MDVLGAVAKGLQAIAQVTDAMFKSIGINSVYTSMDWGTLITRRTNREPVSHITGTRLFWGRPFRVTPDTLDPRPETELLVHTALCAPFATVLDLGTGTGCILLSCLADRPMATGLGTDIDPATLAVAARNAASLGLAARAEFRLSDWCADVTGSFDLILSNPPYIAAAEMADLAPEVRLWEPHRALTPGGDGLAPYRSLAQDAPSRLLPGGRLLRILGHAMGVFPLIDVAGAGRGAGEQQQGAQTGQGTHGNSGHQGKAPIAAPRPGAGKPPATGGPVGTGNGLPDPESTGLPQRPPHPLNWPVWIR